MENIKEKSQKIEEEYNKVLDKIKKLENRQKELVSNYIKKLEQEKIESLSKLLKE